jgi:hypothetical protein
LPGNVFTQVNLPVAFGNVKRGAPTEKNRVQGLDDVMTGNRMEDGRARTGSIGGRVCSSCVHGNFMARIMFMEHEKKTFFS